MLQSMGLQIVGHDWVTEQHNTYFYIIYFNLLYIIYIFVYHSFQFPTPVYISLDISKTGVTKISKLRGSNIKEIHCSLA